jgi:hypothetical protein
MSGKWPTVRPFSERLIEVLQGKYYQRDGNVFGKKFL